MSGFSSKFRGSSDYYTAPSADFPENANKNTNISSYHLANATLLMLARNSDLKGVLQSVREVEDRFNSKFNYPWTFLNNEPFTPEFIKCVIPSCTLKRSLMYV